MKSSVTYPVFGFGKVASSAEFVRWNAATREALALDRWLQEALYLAKASFGESFRQRFARTVPRRFVLFPAGAERLVVGAMTPSADKVGRVFPFVIGTLVDVRRLDAERLPLIPRIFASFFESADALLERVGNGRTVESLVSALGQLGPVVDQRADGGRTVLSTHKHAPSCSARLQAHLREALAPLARRGPAGSSLGLRFLLPSTPSEQPDAISLDLSLCFRHAPDRSAWSNPGYFWSVRQADRNPADLVVYPKGPSPRALRDLIDSNQPSDHVCTMPLCPIIRTDSSDRTEEPDGAGSSAQSRERLPEAGVVP